jgi:hypothetical protein
MNRKSKKFNASGWMEKLIPLILGMLALALVATIVLVLMSIIGILPG